MSVTLTAASHLREITLYQTRGFLKALLTREGAKCFIPFLATFLFTKVPNLTFVNVKDQAGRFRGEPDGETLAYARFENMSGSLLDTGISPTAYSGLVNARDTLGLEKICAQYKMHTLLPNFVDHEVSGVWSQLVRYLNERLTFAEYLAGFQAPLTAYLYKMYLFKEKLDQTTGRNLYTPASISNFVNLVTLTTTVVPLSWAFLYIFRQYYLWSLMRNYGALLGTPPPAALVSLLRTCLLNRIPSLNLNLFLWICTLCFNDFINFSRKGLAYYFTRVMIYLAGYLSLFNRSIFLPIRVSTEELVPKTPYIGLEHMVRDTPNTSTRIRAISNHIPAVEITFCPILLCVIAECAHLSENI